VDIDLGVKMFVIIKGYIDAKDERGNSLFGTILGLVSRREMKYLSVMFSRDETSKSMEWSGLLNLHRDRGSERDRDPVIIHHETELLKYLQRGTVLNNVAKNRNTKQAEQSISRYCLESLQLKAVSFVEYFEAGEADVIFFEREGGGTAGGAADGASANADDSPAPDGDAPNAENAAAETKGKDDIVVRCEPILAPVGGVAMNDLNVGEMVMAKLPEDSVFFKLLSRNIRNFDGVVSASVTGILMNELGTATISLALSDGITGVMKLSGKVRVKTAAPSKESKPASGGFKFSEIPAGFVFGGAGALLLISAAAILFYILR
jgi:hypothetical protein